MQQVSMEQQLDVLSRCGIALLSDRTIDELLISFSREDFESEPFLLLLATLGGDVEDGPSTGARFSDRIWHFDPECIEGDGSYVSIANRLSDLARGDLPIENPRDHVDVESGDVWLEFELDGHTHRLEPEFQNDWADPRVLSWFCSLIDRRRSERRYTYLELGGQDCLIGCATPKEFKALRNMTGLKFQWAR